MRSAARVWLGFGLVVLAVLGPASHDAAAQGPALRVENFYPHQAPPGQTTLFTLAVTSRDAVTGVDVTPPQGITVVSTRRAGGVQGNVSWAEVTLEVAKDAAAGPRTLVLDLPAGRTAPVTITIPTHAPGIADLRATPGASAGVDVQLTATDASADLGELPHVWFTLGCT